MEHCRIDPIEGLDYQMDAPDPDPAPILCESCLGRGKVCSRCDEPPSQCQCAETVGEDTLFGYDPVMCENCLGKGTV